MTTTAELWVRYQQDCKAYTQGLITYAELRASRAISRIVQNNT